MNTPEQTKSEFFYGFALGAERRTNRNGAHTEQGKWVDTGKLNPPETLAQFAARIGVKLWPRSSGVLAIIPMPDLWRQDAYHLSDYYVSASVSGPCLEFLPRNHHSEGRE